MSPIAQIEALLYVAGEDGLSLRELSEILSLSVTGLVQSLEKLDDKYREDPDSSLAVLETGSRYKIVTKEPFADILQRYSISPINQSLSQASLEVLSIVAYKQPVTRVEVDDIRSVNSSGAISKLLALNLIKEAGKKETLGRPNLYATTDYFLDYMGINSLDELVDASNITLNDQTELDLFADRTGEEDAN